MTFCEMIIRPSPVYLKEFAKVESHSADNMIANRQITATATTGGAASRWERHTEGRCE